MYLMIAGGTKVCRHW